MDRRGDLGEQQPNYQKQQQWMAMYQYQYQQQLMAMQMQQHSAAVMMHPNMIYGGQQYMPAAFFQVQQQQQMYQQKQKPVKQMIHQVQSSGDENRTIWIGDLQQWMDETYLQSCFSKAGEVLSVKVIRNKLTGQTEKYGFVEFSSHTVADSVLQTYNGSPMPNAEQSFRLNWAAFSMANKRVDAAAAGGSESDLSSIFVGDLAADVTDAILLETFASKYPSVKSAKVVFDGSSGRSKGFGFVRFGDETERTRSLTEMNGAYCTTRPMRIGIATPKKPGTQQQQYSSQGENGFW